MSRKNSKKLRMDPEWSTNDLDGVLDFVSSLGPFGVVRSIFTGKTPTVPGLATVSGSLRQGVDNAVNWLSDKASSLWDGLKESNIYRKYTGSGLTDAEIQQNEFQERLSNTAYQRQVADMQSAGVNPALTMGGSSSGASTPSGASPSGGASLGDLFGSIVSLVSLPAQLNLLKSQAAKNFADAEGVQIENETRGERNNAILANLRSDLDSKEVQRELAKSNISLNEAKQALDIAQAAYASASAVNKAELDRSMIALNNAKVEYEKAHTEESKKALDVADAQIRELLQRCILEAAQKDAVDSQSNLMVTEARNVWLEGNILQAKQKGAVYEADHVKASFWSGVIAKIVGAGAGAVGAASMVATSIGGLSPRTVVRGF